jgi:hypothetical protein
MTGIANLARCYLLYMPLYVVNSNDLRAAIYYELLDACSGPPILSVERELPQRELKQRGNLGGSSKNDIG